MSRKQATEVENLTEDDTKGIGMKYCVLKQDYQELQRETRALKKRIQRAKMKRDNLLGVVRSDSSIVSKVLEANILHKRSHCSSHSGNGLCRNTALFVAECLGITSVNRGAIVIPSTYRMTCHICTWHSYEWF
eukprot:Gb_39774 [translate_table: standard]